MANGYLPRYCSAGNRHNNEDQLSMTAMRCSTSILVPCPPHSQHTPPVLVDKCPEGFFFVSWLASDPRPVRQGLESEAIHMMSVYGKLKCIYTSRAAVEYILANIVTN
jgi:hypothetical protein